MGLEVKLKVKGLYDSPNTYSAVPPGALKDADNIVIDREDIATPRRGMAYHSDPASVVNALTEYQDKIVASIGTTGLGYYDTSWHSYGSYAAPTGTKMRFIQQAKNLYFTTASGVKKLASYNGTVSECGVPKAINMTATLTTGTWCVADSQVAYRAVWGIKDVNGNVILGTPSERLVVTNVAASGDNAVALTIYIPTSITALHFIQVYRSALSGSDDIVPNDELFLVYEANPTAGEITAKYLTFTDSTPSDLTGATLYISPSQEGILAGNGQPPLAKDMAVFKGYTFYADTETRHNHTVSLLGVGSPNGLQDGDTITIDGVPYRAKNTPSAPTDFQISAAASASKKIEETAQALIKLLNTYTGNTTVYAYYMSGPDDLPGKIRIEARALGAAQFSCVVSRLTAWSQNGTTSSNDDWANGLYYSKFQQPESVPVINYIKIGSDNNAILRIVALRDSLFIFKDQEGVYRLYGGNPNNFQVDLFDSSTRLLAKETVAVLNNAVYGLFDQGVAKVSEVGVSVVSRPIERRLLALEGSILTSIKSYAWAMAYESDRRYILHLPSVSENTGTTQAYTYNTFTNAWTRWVVTHTEGFVRPSDDKMYVGSGLSTHLLVERKAYDFSDIVDEAFSMVITDVASDHYSVTLSDIAGVKAGDLIYQDRNTFAQIAEVNAATGLVTLSQPAEFVVTGGEVSHEIRPAYACTVTWHPVCGDDPMIGKQFREVSLMFTQAYTYGTVRFSNNPFSSGTTLDVVAQGASLGFWGLFPWGDAPWGGDIPNKILRALVPRVNQRAGELTVSFEQSVAYNLFELTGLQVVYNTVGEKVTR